MIRLLQCADNSSREWDTPTVPRVGLQLYCTVLTLFPASSLYGCVKGENEKKECTIMKMAPGNADGNYVRRGGGVITRGEG